MRLDQWPAIGPELGRFGQGRTRQEMLSEHEEALRRLASASGLHALITTNSQDVKPAASFSTPPPLEQCLPIHVSSMSPGTTHRGRLLRGRVAVQRPVVVASIQLLLEDELGDLVKVSMYNMLESQGRNQNQSLEQMGVQAQRMFQQGRCLAVLEPYFKVQADGSLAVRVDNPAEVVFLDQLGPGTASGWQEEGGRHFQAQQFSEASRCFSQALGELGRDSEGTLSAVLMNLSAAAHKLGRGAEALHWAAVALAVDQASNKALYRCALALDVMGLREGVLWAIGEAARLGAFGGGSGAEAIMRTHMRCLGRTAAAGRGAAQGGGGGGGGGKEAVMRALGGECAATQATEEEAVAGGDGGGGSTAAGAAKALKERGNALFLSGDYAASLPLYLRALGQLPLREQAAVLLSNRAACRLKMEGGERAGGEAPPHLLDALLDASAAVALAPALVKPHFRRATALMQLEWLAEAAAAVEQGLRCVPGDAALLGLQRRVASAAEAGARRAAASAAASSSGPSSAAPSGASSAPGGSRTRGGKSAVSGPSEEEAQQAEYASGEDVARLNAVLELMGASIDPAHTRQIMEKMGMRGDTLLDERVAPLHQEFAKEGRWPPQCDIQECTAELRSAFEHARGMRVHEMHLAADNADAHESVPPRDLLARLGCLSEQRLRWLVEAPVGDISFFSSRPYCSTVVHSFSNVPNRSEVLKPGSSHVAVGFVDLGSLCEACMMWEQAEPAEPAASPLHWVGYEASGYCVAKTLVLVQMLKGRAEMDHVLQVWYSAAWSRAALGAFRTALTTLLEASSSSQASPSPSSSSSSSSSSSGGSAHLSPQVLALLRGWQLHDVSLADSRRRWLKPTSRSRSFICNFRRKVDRMALCRYALTGQLLEAEVGSVVMFDIPPEMGKRSMDESVLQTIHIADLLQDVLQNPALDVVAAAVARLRRRIRCLSRLVRAARVNVTVHHQAVSPEDAQLHARIRSLSPWTMSWSNVSDYCGQPSRFHAMARACSAPEDTVHYLHSMNWPQDVKGASYLDLKVSGLSGKTIIKMLDVSEQAISQAYQAVGWDELLLNPPVDNARNILDHLLYVSQYEAWVAAFFKEAGLKDVGRQAALVEPPLYSVLNRTSSTCHMTYTFDAGIRLTPRSHGLSR